MAVNQLSPGSAPMHVNGAPSDEYGRFVVDGSLAGANIVLGSPTEVRFRIANEYYRVYREAKGTLDVTADDLLSLDPLLTFPSRRQRSRFTEKQTTIVRQYREASMPRMDNEIVRYPDGPDFCTIYRRYQINYDEQGNRYLS
jgi:hypothetical protein